MDWQPIETAPKDGTVIIAHCVWEDDGEAYGPLAIQWGDARGGYWGLAGCSSIGIQTNSDPADSIKPMFWQPMPEPPK